MSSQLMKVPSEEKGVVMGGWERTREMACTRGRSDS